MNKPSPKDFQNNPAGLASAYEKYAAGLGASLASGAPAPRRADADDHADASDDDTEDRTDENPAPRVADFKSPADFIQACRNHLARRVDGRTAPARDGRRNDSAEIVRREG